MNLIELFVCAILPPCATDLVVILTSVNPPTVPPKLNVEAPLEASLFVTIYSKIIMLPSVTDLPKIPSPK